jgi:hypothetical protein
MLRVITRNEVRIAGLALGFFAACGLPGCAAPGSDPLAGPQGVFEPRAWHEESVWHDVYPASGASLRPYRWWERDPVWSPLWPASDGRSARPASPAEATSSGPSSSARG